MAARALWRWVCVTARWRFVLASRRQQRSRAAHPAHSAMRHEPGKPHHCLVVIARLWCQSVGTVLLHPAKAFGFGSLRLVLATQWQQRGHAPRQVAALGCRVTSPLSPVRRSVATASQCTRRCCAPCRASEVHDQCSARVGQSAVALGVGCASLAHRGWMVVALICSVVMLGLAVVP